MSNVDFKKVLALAEKYKPDMVKFLRDMVAIPSESCEERDVVLRIKEEMEKVGFDKVVYVSVHDALDVSHGILCPVVLHHRVGLENVAANLASERDVLFLAGKLLVLLLLLFLVILIEP